MSNFEKKLRKTLVFSIIKIDNYVEFERNMKSLYELKPPKSTIEEKNDNKFKFYINPPKKGLTAFFIYQKLRRDSLKKELPKLDNKELVSKMSAEWREMSESDKIHFNKLAEEDKLRYEKEKREYDKNNAFFNKEDSILIKPSVKKKSYKMIISEEDSDSESEEESDYESI
jgi:hypothetical protein